VKQVHDLHVWAISTGKTGLSIHVVCEPSAEDAFAAIGGVRAVLRQHRCIHRSTAQVERRPCEQSRPQHGFGPGTVAPDALHSH
jgi:cobalt-zinc-cadmium efflux system protein